MQHSISFSRPHEVDIANPMMGPPSHANIYTEDKFHGKVLFRRIHWKPGQWKEQAWRLGAFGSGQAASRTFLSPMLFICEVRSQGRTSSLPAPMAGEAPAVWERMFQSVPNQVYVLPQCCDFSVTRLPHHKRTAPGAMEKESASENQECQASSENEKMMDNKDLIYKINK